MTFISYFSLIYARVTHEISRRKNFGPRKYPREGTRPTRPTIAEDPQNLAHSKMFVKVILLN